MEVILDAATQTLSWSRQTHVKLKTKGFIIVTGGACMVGPAEGAQAMTPS